MGVNSLPVVIEYGLPFHANIDRLSKFFHYQITVKTVRNSTPTLRVFVSPMDCVVYSNIDSVHLLLLTAAGWFIRAIVAVVVTVAVVVGSRDTQPGLRTLKLIIATFCKQHGY